MSRRLRLGAARDKAPTPALVATQLTKTYGDVEALAPLDLHVDAGERVVVVGHNGSGKSTLLAMVAGVLEPTGGELSVFGGEPGSIAARAAVSYIPDQPVLYDDLSVREHVEYVARLHGGSAADPALDGLIDTLGLGDRRDQLPSQFSRGLRQKAAIAVALCRPFAILVVDEPFVGLDAAGRESFLALLDEAADEGATLVVATHDPAVLDRFDRCLTLASGELVGDGAPAEISLGDLGG